MEGQGEMKAWDGGRERSLEILFNLRRKGIMGDLGWTCFVHIPASKVLLSLTRS